MPKLASFQVKLVNYPSEKGRFVFLLRSLHFGSIRLSLSISLSSLVNKAPGELPYSQFIDLNDANIEEADNYAELSKQQMMDLCPLKKQKIDNLIPNDSELTFLSSGEHKKFELFIRDYGIKPNFLKSSQELSPFQERGAFPKWWFANGYNFNFRKLPFHVWRATE